MNKFEKQLEKWNGGVLRGAQAKLAKLLQVSTATVALWTTGKRRPSKGFISRMAQLFALDEYDVMRLFPSATLYPDLQARRPAAALRDAHTPENAYSADLLPEGGNSVSLPLLRRIGPDFPRYAEEDVVEWWTLPRRAAMGAKWLTADPINPDGGNEELYFIRPADSAEHGQTVLARLNGTVRLMRVHKQNGTAVFYFLNGQPFTYQPTDLVQILGVAVRKITGNL